MADKTPVRVVFNSSNVATGMAEFQSGETIGTSFGGTGLSSIGSALQVLRVNSAGNALEFGTLEDLGDIGSIGSTLTAPSNADFTIETAGTGNILLNDLSITDNKLVANRSNDDLILAGSGTGSVSIAKVAITGGTITGITDLAVADGGTGASSLTADAVLTGNGTSAITAEGNLSFDGSTLAVTGAATVSTTLTVSGDATLSGIKVSGTTLSSDDSTTINVNEALLVDGTVESTGNITSGGSFIIGSASMDETDLEKLDGITNGTAAANKALVADANIDIGTLRNVTATGTVTAAGFTIGSAAINEAELETIDGVTAGTVAASKAVVVDSNKDVTGFRNVTVEGSFIIGSASMNETDLEKLDGITDGTAAANKAVVADGSLNVAGLNNITITGDFIGDVTTTDITSSSNADINIQPGGTGNVVLGAVTINGTTISSSDSSNLNINENLIVDGTAEVTGNVTASADLSVGDDLSLISDDAVLNFGANSEIKLTHIHDTGLRLTDTGGTPTLQLHDANESIASDGSKVIITSGGTTFNLPTADGTSNQALLTDGSGTLSFGTVTSATSDDTLATVKNNKSIGTSAQTVDSFSESATDAVHYVMVQNDVTNDRVSTMSFNVLHNDTTGFVGGIRGTDTHTANNFSTFTSDSSNNFIRLRLAGPSADTKVSMYRIPLSTANTADATRGNTVTTSNTDVDSASESIDSFAHASFRGAKYFILIDNDSKTETSCVEALVVHDGTDAYISTYGVVNSGNNDLITLTAAIDGSNVVVSAAGLETNLNLTIHKILLSDSMTAAENDNQKVIGATTVSSSATSLDTFSLDKANGAVYYVVGANSSEGAYSIQEIFAAANFTGAAVGNGGFVSTKETTQLTFTGDISSTAHNTYQLSAASTSGSNTTVNAYRINLKAE